MKNVITVDKIKDMLFETVWERMPDSKYINVRLSDKDVARIHSLLISKLPEKMVRSEVFEGESDGTIEAYNSAIDNVKAVLDEMFRSGDGR